MGAQIAISRLAWSTYTQSDGIVVGRVLGAAVLGTYQMAMTLASAPADKISTLVMRAAGPLFAKVQKDEALVRRYFLIILEALGLTVLPIMLGLAVVAPDATQVVLGAKWSASASPLFWLALFVTIRTASVLCDQVLVALRKTRFTMSMSLLAAVVMPAAFVVASRWGVTAVAASWLILSPVTVLPMLAKLGAVARLRFSEALDALLPGLAASGAMLIAAGFVREWHSANVYLRLVAEICAGGAVYFAVLLGPFREKVLRYIRFVKSLRQEAILK
jgi:PST family polysaccharide transporter